MNNKLYIKRNIEKYLKEFANFFPVIAVIGPRQSGKTTLVKNFFANYYYLNLENLDVKQAAVTDPRGFLEKLLSYDGVIIDEFQNAPELLSYLQIIVDREKCPGFFILTGSQNFLVSQSISQSLAGRVGILTLLPLSIQEVNSTGLQAKFAEEAIFRGSYPKIFEMNNLAPQYVYPSYIQTYLERDVRTITNVTNLTLFKKFLGLCAARAGQLLNVSALASDAGVSIQTVNAWLSILQASYIIFLQQPYHHNFNKRLIKSPKLYFFDTGILCSLLGLENVEQLENHYLRGALFENFIVSDIYKQFFNRAQNPNIYFWRDSHGNEVDCVVERGLGALPIEIKASMTFDTKFISGLVNWNKLAGFQKSMLIYGGTEEFVIKDCEVKSWRNFAV